MLSVEQFENFLTKEDIKQVIKPNVLKK